MAPAYRSLYKNAVSKSQIQKYIDHMQVRSTGMLLPPSRMSQKVGKPQLEWNESGHRTMARFVEKWK